ncbi:MAG TPA: branched-chain amino acid transaminase [Anaerolineales bacterium]|nr:branched-chain amino acid transaminase [Anaerolineales bacterium]
MAKQYVWMNGGLVESEKAMVHFLVPALHYGAGVFEGIRAYATDNGPAVFRLKEHARRLVNSALIFGFRDLPWTPEQIADAIKEVVRANALESCYIRPLIYFDGTAGSLNLDAGKASLGIAAWEWNNYLGDEALAKGIRANVSSFTRHQPNVMMTKAKIAGNYANSILAKTESSRLGFDEAIMLDPQGYVAECTGENLFLVRNNKIISTQLADTLEGITRDSLITIARDLGYEVVEALVSRDQLYIADEVFVCGTAAECIGLSEIDFRKIGEGKTGPVTRALQKEFHAATRGKSPRYQDWLAYVNTNIDIPQLVE